MCDLLAREEKDIIGQKCYWIFHGMEKPWPGCPHVKAVQTGRTVVEKIDDPHIGRPLMVSCSPIFNDNGKMHGVVHIAKDIQKEMVTQWKEQLNSPWKKSLLDDLKEIEGYLLICASCKKFKNEKEEWISFDEFLGQQPKVVLSHGICPQCYNKITQDLK